MENNTLEQLDTLLSESVSDNIESHARFIIEGIKNGDSAFESAHDAIEFYSEAGSSECYNYINLMKHYELDTESYSELVRIVHEYLQNQ